MEPFNVDEAASAEANHSPFVFILDGHQRQLPHMLALTLRQQLDLDLGAAQSVLPEVADEDTAAAILGAPTYKAAKLFEAWREHARVKPGESEASTGS